MSSDNMESITRRNFMKSSSLVSVVGVLGLPNMSSGEVEGVGKVREFPRKGWHNRVSSDGSADSPREINLLNLKVGETLIIKNGPSISPHVNLFISCAFADIKYIRKYEPLKNRRYRHVIDEKNLTYEVTRQK